MGSRAAETWEVERKKTRSAFCLWTGPLVVMTGDAPGTGFNLEGGRMAFSEGSQNGSESSNLQYSQ